MWRDLETQVGPADVIENDQPIDLQRDDVAGVIRRRAERRGRRVFRSTYLS
jgi:hypothetical protein